MSILFGCKAVLRLYRKKSAPARRRVDYIWKSDWAGLLLVSGFIVLSAIWFHWIPSPGKAVAALAVGATIMTFRGELGGLEKFFWTGVLFALLLIEVKAIDKDRTENNEAQREERRILTGMASNIQLSFQSVGAQEAYIASHLPVKLPDRTPTLMVPESRTPPSTVIIAPSYGNLRQQAIDLSQQLYFLLNAEQQRNDSIPSNATKEQRYAAISLATESMSRDYITSYHNQVLRVVGDLAKLNFHDRNVDQVLDVIEQERISGVNLLAGWVINGAGVYQLASGLTSLASQIPPTTQPALPAR